MKHSPHYETLDPDDWEAMRALAHRMIDDAIDYTRDIRQQPVWKPLPEDVAATFTRPAPLKPTPPELVYETFLQTIFPYPMGNPHPRFWAWYMGNGTITGALADFMAAVMNPNLGGGEHAANHVEAQVIQWLKALMDFPEKASGLLVSGASMANLMGIAVARNVLASRKLGINIRQAGLQSTPRRMVVYASTEVHSCNQKAVELLGMGSEGLRKIPVNNDFTIDVCALAQTIVSDRMAGREPIAIIASAGTVNTGAIDNLEAIADLCREHDLWFHVDGAIGAIAVLAENVKPRLTGIERADSIALDLHKWLHIPFEAGCILVRDGAIHRDTFALVPEYLEHEERGLASGQHWFSDYGLQLSRHFRALKVWMSIQEHGLDRLGRMIGRNVEQASYLGRLIAAHPRLELIAPIGLDIVCFRFQDGNESVEKLNALNKEILTRLQEQGIAAPSYTTLNGIYCIRVAIANHRSRFEDFDLLVEAVVKIGDRLFTEI